MPKLGVVEFINNSKLECYQVDECFAFRTCRNISSSGKFGHIQIFCLRIPQISTFSMNNHMFWSVLYESIKFLPQEIQISKTGSRRLNRDNERNRRYPYEKYQDILERICSL